MASFTILVTHSPFDAQSAYSAWRFADAVLNSEHTLLGVFFYQSGVINASRFLAGHSDEVNMYKNWVALHTQSNVPLQVCVTAANRRGIINQTDAADMDINHYNLAPPFAEVGLGDLITLMDQADRTIQF